MSIDAALINLYPKLRRPLCTTMEADISRGRGQFTLPWGTQRALEAVMVATRPLIQKAVHCDGR